MDTFLGILVHVGNVLSVIYNIPQMWLTYKNKKATDISAAFLWMRLASSIIWCVYSIYYQLWLVIVSWAMSLVSSSMILYYKYYPQFIVVNIDENNLSQIVPLVEVNIEKNN